MATPPANARRAEAVGARLPPLLVAAERVASTVAQGVHGRRRVGQGDSFWQFRRFVAGDPTARIDWRQSAKSGRPVLDGWFIRETEWGGGTDRQPVARRVGLDALALPRGADRETRASRPSSYWRSLSLRAAARRRARAADARGRAAGVWPEAAWTGSPRTSPAQLRTTPACRRSFPLAATRQRGYCVRRLPVPADRDPGHGRPICRGSGHRLSVANPRSGRDAAALCRPHPLPWVRARGRHAG